jgi:hypothetical protein
VRLERNEQENVNRGIGIFLLAFEAIELRAFIEEGLKILKDETENRGKVEERVRE